MSDRNFGGALKGDFGCFLQLKIETVLLNPFTLPNSVYYKLSIGMGSHDQPWCV